MLCRDPVRRWSLPQVRACEWFRKKHPLVREDLASLPDEVVHNEYATFRMISYLEKLCQLKSADELTSDDFKPFYDEMAGLSLDSGPRPAAPQPPAHSVTAKELSQAAKAKKTHCSLM